jgi:antitoxin component HigA of HigAB toxin-antitoxin module
MEGAAMSTAILSRQMPKTYPQLVRLMAPRTIRDDVDLDNVTEIVDRLAVLSHPTKDQADYLETLSTLIAAYENARHQIDVSHLGPLETLKFLLQEHGLSGSDLGRILGQRQLGPAILRGERQLSKTHIVKLAGHFGVSPNVFLE